MGTTYLSLKIDLARQIGIRATRNAGITKLKHHLPKEYA